MSSSRIDGGRVRSVREAKLALAEIPCPKCGKPMIMVRATKPDASGYVIHVRSRQCGEEFDIAFSPGPGWDQRPSESAAEIAATEAPSEVIPETRFVWYFERAMASLVETEPAPSDEGKLEVWEEGARVTARDALGSALEVGKLARAAKRELPPEMARAIPWLRAIIEDPHILSKGTSPP